MANVTEAKTIYHKRVKATSVYILLPPAPAALFSIFIPLFSGPVYTLAVGMFFCSFFILKATSAQPKSRTCLCRSAPDLDQSGRLSFSYSLPLAATATTETRSQLLRLTARADFLSLAST